MTDTNPASSDAAAAPSAAPTATPPATTGLTADRGGQTLTLAELAGHDAPFAAETAELFAAVRDHDLTTLAARCDDDFGIVDIDPTGGSEVLRSRHDWETWFVQLFAQLDAMDADTDTLIERYDAVDWGDTGMGVVEFDQLLTVAGRTGHFHCIVTIVWKRVGDRWIEARWHASLLHTDLPEGFGEAA
jgi:hypothetical protein